MFITALGRALFAAPRKKCGLRLPESREGIQNGGISPGGAKLLPHVKADRLLQARHFVSLRHKIILIFFWLNLT
jgi:hypothetical protein